MKTRLSRILLSIFLILNIFSGMVISTAPRAPIQYWVYEKSDTFLVEILDVDGLNMPLDRLYYSIDSIEYLSDLNHTIAKINNLTLNSTVSIVFHDNDYNNIFSKGDTFETYKNYSVLYIGAAGGGQGIRLYNNSHLVYTDRGFDWTSLIYVVFIIGIISLVIASSIIIIVTVKRRKES